VGVWLPPWMWAYDSGEAALEHLYSSGKTYDLILLDWMMPGLNGSQVAEKIRTHVASEQPPIIMMVTAYGREMSEHQVDESNLDGVLVKPITSSQLFDAIIKAKTLVSEEDTQTKRRPTSKEAATLPRLKEEVLLADSHMLKI